MFWFCAICCLLEDFMFESSFKIQELEIDNTNVDHLFCFVILLESTDLFEPKVHHMVRNTIMEVSEVGFLDFTH